MIRFLIATLTACCLLVGCGDSDDSLGYIGDSCVSDDDCDGFCLKKLEGEWLGEWEEITFPGGMCTAECAVPGEWSEDGFDMCLLYSPTGAQYLFPSCRNDGDCRTDEGYFCATVGFDVDMQATKVCLPPGV